METVVEAGLCGKTYNFFLVLAKLGRRIGHSQLVFAQTSVEEAYAFGVGCYEKLGQQVTSVGQAHEHERYADHGVEDGQYLSLVALWRDISVA